jgi:peptidoglycan/LPS O-acetylase OafA/YrhL
MATTLEAAIATAGEIRGEDAPFSSQQHLPALDGLRGVAIVAVMLFHFMMMQPRYALELPLVALGSCGWIGVDLFFALSGFLITGVLIDTRDAPGYARTFYARRALRIVPLYLVAVLAFTLVFDLHAVKWWYWTHTTNIMIAMSGRWDAAVGSTTHLWSLAVEEQFYLMWPLLVALCPPRRLGVLCVVVATAGAALRLLLLIHGTSPITIYTLMPTHVDGIALGGALAAARRSPSAWRTFGPWARSLGNIPAPRWGTFGTLGFLGILALDRSAAYDAPALQAAGYPLIAMAAVVLIAGALEASPESALGRWLTSRMLRALGKDSYCLYIIHPLLIYSLKELLPHIRRVFEVAGSQLLAQLVYIALGGTASFAIAWLSYRFLEHPFLSLKRYFPIKMGALPSTASESAGLPA